MFAESILNHLLHKVESKSLRVLSICTANHAGVDHRSKQSHLLKNFNSLKKKYGLVSGKEGGSFLNDLSNIPSLLKSYTTMLQNNGNYVETT